MMLILWLHVIITPKTQTSYQFQKTALIARVTNKNNLTALARVTKKKNQQQQQQQQLNCFYSKSDKKKKKP